MVDKSLIQQQLLCHNLDELGAVARAIAAFSDDSKVWVFKGEMGAGKTTLIKAICEYFNVEDTVTSPTFSIVNEYRNAKGEIFYHFDFYRIKDETEAVEIGCEEYFDSGDYCFIEWPSKIESLLPDRYVEIDVKVTDQNVRQIELKTRYE